MQHMRFRHRLSISIHAPREGCDLGDGNVHYGYRHISIHAPREGCDLDRYDMNRLAVEFQSTHSVRGATNLQPPLWRTTEISIHAPREGCDSIGKPYPRLLIYFNPRTP